MELLGGGEGLTFGVGKVAVQARKIPMAIGGDKGILG